MTTVTAQNELLGDSGLDPSAAEALIGGDEGAISFTAVELINSYAHIFFIAFVLTLFATPLVRRMAVAAGIVDHPNDPRKIHQQPVAYLGGVAVFLGLMIALAVSYVYFDSVTVRSSNVPVAIIIGMIAITFTGLADDVWGWDPGLKIAGQLVAAAALAIEDVGVRVADGLLTPLLGAPDEILFIIGEIAIANGSLYYWVGTAIIAVFVLGGCNAANLIDGLDGLLSGVVAIVTVGLLCIALFMAVKVNPEAAANPQESLIGARIVLCMALLGAVLGFLPHNFNPATIFLGDCGSLLLGYMCVVIILMFGEMGQTHLVFAGLIVFALPIMDTVLAIIRRIMAGTPLSTADNHHIHHQMKRSLGSVRKAVVGLYGISLIFAAIGVTLAALVMFTQLRIRAVYAIAFVLFSSIGVIAVKEARHTQYRAAHRTVTGRSSSAQPTAPSRDEADAPASAAKPAAPSAGSTGSRG